MKNKKILLIAIAYLLITFLVVAAAYPGMLSSTASLRFPKPGKYAPVLAEAEVGAEILYRTEQYENTIDNGIYHNVHSESKPYLSRQETLALYSPPNAATQNSAGLNIPEGCEVSTNLAYEKTLFKLINEEREKRSLPLLAWSDELSSAARKHSIDMACNDYFSHTNLDGQTFDERIGAEGYPYYAVGENIYAGDDVFNSPLRAFNGWFYSTRHFRVMTHTALTEVGIGYVYCPSSQHGGYFTADFATPE